MIKKITLLAVFTLLPFFGFSQSKGCEHLKNGTFKVTDPASKKVCIIKRNGNLQTERMEESSETYDFDLAWVDDCTYTISPTASTLSRNRDVAKAGLMTVRIINAKDSTYTQKVTVSTNKKFRRIDEVTMIKDRQQ